MLCAQCGLETSTERALCWQHEYTADPYWERWAEHNRIWCDFFHRGKPLPKIPWEPDEKLVSEGDLE